jgi:hypothetical protein
MFQIPTVVVVVEDTKRLACSCSFSSSFILSSPFFSFYPSAFRVVALPKGFEYRLFSKLLSFIFFYEFF